MSLVTFGLTLIILYCMASLVYVYAYRGTQTYASFTEFIRKGWPLTSPLNSFLYLFTEKKALRPIMNIEDFPELSPIVKNWKVIQEEAIALKNQNIFEKTTDKNSDSFYDLGFRTFYKYGWSKFYLTWYGSTHNSAKRLMPKSVDILSKIPNVNGSMLAILPPRSNLTRHLDPMACSLRFHMGLKTPNSDDCFINVDGQTRSWRDGEAFCFDETYLHFVENNTDEERLILMCDIDRPMTSWIGRAFNWFYKLIARPSVVPNTPEDQKGLINQVFSALAPILKKTKALKETNVVLYKIIKHTVNGTLLFIVLGVTYLVLSTIQGLIS